MPNYRRRAGLLVALTTSSKKPCLMRCLKVWAAQTIGQVEYRRVGGPFYGKAKVEKRRFVEPPQRIIQRRTSCHYEFCKMMTVQNIAFRPDHAPKTSWRWIETDCAGLRPNRLTEAAYHGPGRSFWIAPHAFGYGIPRFVSRPGVEV
jgi:hypothetical protein